MIDVSHVSRAYGDFLAVDDVSFSVRKGEIVGLLGPNGAGKTTTMRMITGFLEPTSGAVTIDGTPMTGEARELKRKIGYMPESAPLYGEMFVADYLAYVAAMQGIGDPEKIPSIAAVCGLEEVMHKNICDLSRGYRQRVGLAHSLLHDPEILILDEPTSGLDPNQIIEVRNLIRSIGTTRTVIISTHILSEVEMLCDRVVIISRGRIVADSPTKELRARYARRSTLRVQTAGCKPEEFARALGKVPGVSEIALSEGDELPDGTRLSCAELSVGEDSDPRPRVFALARDSGWTLYEMTVRKNSLEDVFRELTTGGDEQ